MGIQQHMDQRGGSVESSIQDQPGTIRTYSYVLWTVQFSSNLPGIYERYLSR